MTSNSTKELLGQIEVEAIFNWVEQQPELSELRSKANNTLCEYRPGEQTPELRIVSNDERQDLKSKRGLIKTISEIVWVPGQSMRGKAFSTPELDNSLNSVAKLMCISTLWDFLTTIPLFQFSLSGPLSAAAGPMATLLSFILLWASNVAGENSTDRRRGHSQKASWSLMAFLLLCSAKTVFSGVGVDLWIGSRGIASTYASQLAVEKLAKDKTELKQIESSGADFKSAEKACAELEKQMKGLDRSTNEKQFISLFVRAYGQNSVTISDRGLSPNQLIKRYGSVGSIPGVCRQRDSLQGLNMEKARPLADAIDTKSQAIAQKPPLAYLQLHEKDLFEEHFRLNNGALEWVNGAEAVGQATNQFYSNLFAGNLGILGFSLFTLSISIILTGAAGLLLYQISLNKQVQASFSGELLEFRDEILDVYQKVVSASKDSPISPFPKTSEEEIDKPIEILQPIKESEAFEAKSLRWLRKNARTATDRYYATMLYRLLIIDLWRKYIAETGQTYYPKLRNDLMDHYRLMDDSGSSG